MAVIVLTEDEIMRKGLELCGFDRRRQRNVSRLLNIRRFTVFGFSGNATLLLGESVTEMRAPFLSAEKP